MTFQMTKSQAIEHQRKNGFVLPPELQDGAKAIIDFAGKPKRRQMNKTEAQFSQILEVQKQRGEIMGWSYECVKLRIGDQCFYTPDFMVERMDELPLFIETKGGFIREDAMVKFRAAKTIHGWADFEMWAKRDGQWKRLF